jgi:hypothetical protein
MNELDLDYELKLPDDLRELSYADKKQLYNFKKTHMPIEYEHEIMNMIDQFSKTKDFERLKNMAGSAKVATSEVTHGATKVMLFLLV